MTSTIKKTIFAAVLLAVCTCAFAQHKVAITAHRGAWQSVEANGAQNSLSALKKAQDMGLWGSEFDLHLTSDGQVLVHHDRNHEGVDLQTNPLSAFTAFRLQDGKPIPTLDEYLDQAKYSDKTVLVVELKKQYSEEREDEMIDRVVAALQKRGLFIPERCIFISFSLHACQRMVTKAPGFTNQYLSGNIAPAELKQMGINGIDYNQKVFQAHPEWVKEAHDLGMSVNVWTVDKEEVIREMIDLGVDCITTNEPELVRSILGDRELRN